MYSDVNEFWENNTEQIVSDMVNYPLEKMNAREQSRKTLNFILDVFKENEGLDVAKTVHEMTFGELCVLIKYMTRYNIPHAYDEQLTDYRIMYLALTHCKHLDVVKIFLKTPVEYLYSCMCSKTEDSYEKGLLECNCDMLISYIDEEKPKTVGELFESLNKRATKVYMPFMDISTFKRQILDTYRTWSVLFSDIVDVFEPDTDPDKLMAKYASKFDISRFRKIEKTPFGKSQELQLGGNK